MNYYDFDDEKEHRRSKNLSSEQLRKYYQQRGYAVIPNLYPDSGDGVKRLPRLLLHFAAHVDKTFQYAISTNVKDPAVKAELSRDFVRASFSRRLAILLALSGRAVFDAMSVALNSMHKGFVFAPTAPMFYRDPVYQAMFNSRLLRSITELLGDDFVLGPRLQPVIRLSHDELELVDILSRQLNQKKYESQSLFNIHVGGSPWYCHSQQGLSAAAQSEVLNVCIALTAGNAQNGGYSVIPGSQRYPQRRSPSLFELRRQQRIELNPGDVLLFDNHLFVSHQCNCWDQEPFIAMVFQFYPTGSYGGFPHLPGFRIHRNDEARLIVPNRQWWCERWRRSLAALDKRKLARLYRVSDQYEARRLSQEFRELENQLK